MGSTTETLAHSRTFTDSPNCLATWRTHALSHANPTASSKSLLKGAFARQLRYLLDLYPALGTTNPVQASWRAPLPWRSAQESRLIRALAWRWYKIKEPRCGCRQIARCLGVSHTYIQKLVREFEIDTRNIVQRQRAYGSATFANLRRAQEETTQLRERGWLRRSARRLDASADLLLMNVRCGIVPSPIGKQIPCDPLIEVKHSMLEAEANRGLQPVPFFRRGALTGGEGDASSWRA